MASGWSNHKVQFKGCVKGGVSELMAVRHKASNSTSPFTSAMIGIVTDSIVRP